jgi:hypothetical protein
MYGVILTLISREFGIELPVEVLKNICQNAIVRAPWCSEIPPHALWWASAVAQADQVRLTSMRAAVDCALWDFIGGSPESYGLRLKKYTPAHRKTQENMDIKAFCLDMERQHTNNSFIDIVPRFDGWITCGKPVGKYRNFELAAIWPTLYGKDGWALPWRACSGGRLRPAVPAVEYNEKP